MRKKIPSSLSEAFDLLVETAGKKRKPIKAAADFMGVEVKTLYRWLSDMSMPTNRIRQFEAFCEANFVSEYLCLASGQRVVIDIPIGKKTAITDVAAVQANAAHAITLLSRFYAGNGQAEETIAALVRALTDFAYHRQNVTKSLAPELDFGGEP